MTASPISSKSPEIETNLHLERQQAPASGSQRHLLCKTGSKNPPPVWFTAKIWRIARLGGNVWGFSWIFTWFQCLAPYVLINLMSFEMQLPIMCSLRFFGSNNLICWACPLPRPADFDKPRWPPKPNRSKSRRRYTSAPNLQRCALDIATRHAKENQKCPCFFGIGDLNVEGQEISQNKHKSATPSADAVEKNVKIMESPKAFQMTEASNPQTDWESLQLNLRYELWGKNSQPTSVLHFDLVTIWAQSQTSPDKNTKQNLSTRKPFKKKQRNDPKKHLKIPTNRSWTTHEETQILCSQATGHGH